MCTGDFDLNSTGDELAFISSNPERDDKMTKIYYYKYIDYSNITRLFASSSLSGYDYMDIASGNFKGGGLKSQQLKGILPEQFNNEHNNDFIIFPNPSNGLFTLKVNDYKKLLNL